MQSFDKIWQILQKYSLIVSILIVGISFICFYPAKSVNVDEVSYLSNAHLVLQNNWVNDCHIADNSGQFSIGDHCVSKYNIGTSLFLIPAALTSDKLAFAISLIVFILGILAFAKILEILELNPVLIYLYALFPAFIYFSRTLLSETYSATLITFTALALLHYAKDPRWKWAICAGIAASLAILVRNTNIIPLFFLFAGFVLQNYRSSFSTLLKKSLPLVISIIPGLLILLLINWLSYGSPFSTGYALSGEQGVFIFSQVPLFLLRFCIALSLIYPLMLIIPFFTHFKLNIGIILAVFSTILFYSGFPSTVFEGRLLDLILGVRFLIPIIPLLLICYSVWLNKYLTKRTVQAIFICALIVLLCSTVSINYIHQLFLLS